MESLPYIDEHRRHVDAPVDEVWTALLRMLRGMTGGLPLARVLGCEPRTATTQFAGVPGDAVPGFRVVDVEPGRRLSLRGKHRFSRYELTFVLDEGELRAVTHAAFPGVLGRLYRAAVISSGVHAFVTRHMLRRVARRV